MTVGIMSTGVGALEGCDILNGVFEMHYGVSEPITTWPFQNWGDTSANLWKQRNQANSDFIIRGVLDKPWFGLAETTDGSAGADRIGTTSITSVSGNTVQSQLESITNILTNGWISLPACTYVSATTFTISGDYTSILQKGDKIKLTQTTAKYFYVVSVSYSAPDTTVTVFAGASYSLANETIESPYYSHIENPMNFPGTMNLPAITYSSEGGAFTNAPSTTFAYFWINGEVLNFVIRYAYHATSGGTGDTYLSLTGLPAPTVGHCHAHRYTDTKTCCAQYINSSTRFEVALYDGSTCIGNNYIIMLGGNWKY